HNGTLIKEVGDGTLASFPLASDAVRCAIDIQTEAKSQEIPLKIGVHQGEMVMAGADVLGDGVNVASRLQEASKEGCITISGKVYSDIKNKAGINTKFIGEQTLKGVDDPVKVYEVLCEEPEQEALKEKSSNKIPNRILYYLLAGAVIIIAAILIWYNLPKQPDIVVEKSIAVLPFRNDSPDPENEYFCNGMMEEILDKLQKIGDLNVYARTATEKYRNTTQNPKEIGLELEAANIVEGSVRMYGNRFTIHVQLIQTKTGYHLWSEVFDGILSDTIFIVQRRIAEKIAGELNAVITPLEKQRIERMPTSNIVAYRKYLKGRDFLREYWNMGDNKSLGMAEQQFRESLEIDPKFAMGYAGLADIYYSIGVLDSLNFYADKILEYDPYNYWGYLHKGEFYEGKGDIAKALESFEKGLELDSNWYWNHVNLGRFYCSKIKDYRTGLRYFKKGEEICIKEKRRDATLYLFMGDAFLNIGYYEKAKQHYKTALEINPNCRNTTNYCWSFGLSASWDMALDMYDSLLCNIPECGSICNQYKVWAFIILGEYSQAEVHWIDYLDASGNPNANDSVVLAFIYNELGREEEAITILMSSQNSLESRLAENKTWSRFLFLSFNHAILDDKEKALEYLSKAAELGLPYGWHDLVEIHPIFKNLRDDPEFKAIVKRAQDEKAAQRAIVQEMIERGEIDL
ncbi:tetratricopeptide repeat protein, partial [Bacteroidota bacterium]